MRRIPLTVVVLGIGLLAAASAAGADTVDDRTAPLTVTATAWYSAAATGPIGTASVPPGDLPVGRTALGEDKRAYVALAMPTDVTTATMMVGPSAGAGASFGESGSIAACQVTETWSPGTGRDLASAPAIDCGHAPLGHVAGAEWHFDLTPIIERWAEGAPNLGVALVALPGTGSAAAWQITFSVPPDTTVGSAVRGGTSPTALDGRGEPTSEPIVTAPSQGAVDVFDLPDLPVPSRPLVVDDAPAAVEVPQAGGTATEAAIATPTAGAAVEALPVNPLAWGTIPLGVLVLIVLGKGLAPGTDPPTALDRLLAS